MPELWGEDDYLYGDYLKWKRQTPLVLVLLGIITIGGIVIVIGAFVAHLVNR